MLPNGVMCPYNSTTENYYLNKDVAVLAKQITQLNFQFSSILKYNVIKSHDQMRRSGQYCSVNSTYCI